MNTFADELLTILHPIVDGLGFEKLFSSIYGSEEWKTSDYPLLAVEAAEESLSLYGQLDSNEKLGDSIKSDEIIESAVLIVFYSKKTDESWENARKTAVGLANNLTTALGRTLEFADGDNQYAFSTQPMMDTISNVPVYAIKITLKREVVRFLI